MEKQLEQIRDKDIRKTLELLLDALKPLMNESASRDAVMDVTGVANYLKVKPSWVYKKVQFKEMPFTHMGKYPRFKRTDIDAWIDAGYPADQTQFNGLKVA